MKYEYLSYPLGENTPLFRDNPPVKIRHQFSTDKGDLFNQAFFQTINHNGTHIDGPRHFNPLGKSLYEMPAESFIFSKIGVIKLKKEADELITAKDLTNFSEIISNSDLLLIKTGFGKFRKNNPKLYGWNNPGFTRSAGNFLMEHKNIKAIGFDFASASASQHLEEGIAFHQIVLGKDRLNDNAILIIEDMNLEKSLEGIQRVFAFPLLIEGLDSGPATIIAEFDDN